jgi:hypothetical protein
MSEPDVEPAAGGRGCAGHCGCAAAAPAAPRRAGPAAFTGVTAPRAYQLFCADLRHRAASSIPPITLPVKEVNASWRLNERRHSQCDGHFHVLARTALEMYNISVVIACEELAQLPDDSLVLASASPIALPPVVLDLTLGNDPPPEVPSVIDLEHDGGTRRVSLVHTCNVGVPATSSDEGASADDESAVARVLCLGFDEHQKPFWLARRFPLIGEEEAQQMPRDFAWPSSAPHGPAQTSLPGAGFSDAAVVAVARIPLDDTVYLPEGLAPLLAAARARVRATNASADGLSALFWRSRVTRGGAATPARARTRPARPRPSRPHLLLRRVRCAAALREPTARGCWLPSRAMAAGRLRPAGSGRAQSGATRQRATAVCEATQPPRRS